MCGESLQTNGKKKKEEKETTKYVTDKQTLPRQEMKLKRAS